MKTTIIQKKIDKAIQHEEKSNKLSYLVMQAARQNGYEISLSSAREVTEYVKKYIKAVPFLIKEGMSIAGKLGIQYEMQRILSELEQYWIEENDLIPDYEGLIGITDDAYASLFLLQTMSDYCRQMYNQPLIQFDLNQWNSTFKNILGTHIASMLEQKVNTTIAQNIASHAMTNMLNRIAQAGFSFNSNPFQGYINQQKINEQVNVQMGAMGIF